MDKTAPFDNTQGKPLANGQSNPATATPVSPVSSPQKELGPIGQGEPTYLERSEQKPEIAPELKELGVETKNDELEVPYEAKQAGLTIAKESAPVDTVPQGTVTLPLTAQQSLDILKVHKNITEAITWLATWCLRQLKLKGEA